MLGILAKNVQIRRKASMQRYIILKYLTLINYSNVSYYFKLNLHICIRGASAPFDIKNGTFILIL